MVVFNVFWYGDLIIWNDILELFFNLFNSFFIFLFILLYKGVVE